MRYNLKKKHSTKTERIVYEILKEFKTTFRHRWIISGVEVDFLIGDIVIEIDGHEQNIQKNNLLAQLGYTPIHLHNSEVNRTNIIKILNDYKN